jgi:hypothetical protein
LFGFLLLRSYAKQIKNIHRKKKVNQSPKPPAITRSSSSSSLGISLRDCLEVVGLFFVSGREAPGDEGRAGRPEEALCGGLGFLEGDDDGPC